MTISIILDQLRAERDRIQTAIDALESSTPTGKKRGRPKGRTMSAEARARISAGMKQRWADRKRNK